MGELNPYIRQEHEPDRLLAEQNGELDHIIPDLRPLAVKVGWLNLDTKNSQDHDPRNLKVIAGSLTAFGQRTPLTVNWTDTLIANRITKGNGTFMSASMLGWIWIAAVGTSDAEDDAMAYGQLDNRSSALGKLNYSQASANAKRLKELGHPILELMYEDDEVLPLLHDEFAPKEETQEQFDAGMLRGRAISKVTASERIVIDQAIELIRAQNSKALTEGAALEKICKEYLEVTAVKTAVNSGIGEMPTPAIVVEEDVLPLV